MTSFYDNQFAKEREVNGERETNLRAYYDNDLEILRAIIAAKEE